MTDWTCTLSQFMMDVPGTSGSWYIVLVTIEILLIVFFPLK